MSINKSKISLEVFIKKLLVFPRGFLDFFFVCVLISKSMNNIEHQYNHQETQTNPY